MSQVLNLKRGDTAPAFRARCLDGTDPVDLATATSVKFLMRDYAGQLVVTAPMTIEDQTTSPGWVSRPWQASDLVVADTYSVEVEVTWSNGTVQTFPPSGYATILVSEDLG
jgi:hypothetical protein